MSKQLKPVNKLPIPNELHVKTCKVCKGKPIEKPFDTGKHIGIACEECYHVISWKLKPKEK